MGFYQKFEMNYSAIANCAGDNAGWYRILGNGPLQYTTLQIVMLQNDIAKAVERILPIEKLQHRHT